MSDAEYIVVLVTAGSPDEAERIAEAVVKEGLAACVNIIGGCTSIYLWREKLEKENECLLFIKSSAAKFEKLASRIEDLHSYEVPEIIAVPPSAISRNYRKYLESVLDR